MAQLCHYYIKLFTINLTFQLVQSLFSLLHSEKSKNITQLTFVPNFTVIDSKGLTVSLSYLIIDFNVIIISIIVTNKHKKVKT